MKYASLDLLWRNKKFPLLENIGDIHQAMFFFNFDLHEMSKVRERMI